MSQHDPHDLETLPPSAKLVARVLAADGPLTQTELAEETFLPRRTVRYAIRRLEDRELLEQTPSLQDARQDRYELVTDPWGDGGNN